MREKLDGLSAWEMAAEAALRVKRRATRAYHRVADQPDKSYLTDDDLKAALVDGAVPDVARRIREGERPHLTSGLGNLTGTADIFKQLFPESVEEIKRLAEAILAHRIPVFGREFDLGSPIDWHADPSTRKRWPLLHFTLVPVRLEPGSDVRSVWELNRLQHLTVLGQAYALTGDERYTEEFLSQIASWFESNPPHFGVNWMIAMEAGIRTVSLIAALELFRSSPLLGDEAVALILKLLIAHGRFIRTNLEFSYRVTSNHYLSNLIGLFALGMTLPDLKESKSWVEFSRSQLLQEMNKQVLTDGVNYEGTIGYHRFVLEIFTLFFSLCRANGIEVPPGHEHRLEAMFDFARHYMKPDRTAPSIGDSDDGRVLRFKARPALDHSYLLSIAAVMFEEGSFKDSDRIDEEAIWWFGEEGLRSFMTQPAIEGGFGSRAFKESQIYIQRAGPLYAIIDCGDHGARGRGSHAHSDALSIDLFAFDHTFLRDPGTFGYTADEELRDLFRSTAYHNTVRIDGRDISPSREGQPFSLGRNVRPEIHTWETTDERDTLDAVHHAYANLAEPVEHRRVVTFEKQAGYWKIKDTFAGSGSHQFEFFFNFDSDLDVSIYQGHRVVARAPHSALAIIPAARTEGLEMEIEERWVSAAYGTRTLASAIIFRLQALVPFENTILLIPYRAGDEAKVKAVVSSHLSFVTCEL
ncbi:MAG TPA: alginate lyase family protein [Blastocatellia bacterium]|nr:alginate lyase family protein [Blastocatellia bacterium]